MRAKSPKTPCMLLGLALGHTVRCFPLSDFLNSSCLTRSAGCSFFPNPKYCLCFILGSQFLVDDQSSLSLSASGGLLSPMRTSSGHENSVVSTIDRFKIGGPLSMRGFGLNGISSNNGFLGSTAYWQCCSQWYFPLPYLRRKNTWIADNLRGHAFCEAGSVGNPLGRTFFKAMSESWTLDSIRASLGVGMVLRLGDCGRAELNYCVPIRSRGGDRIRHGLQMGIGVEFS